MVTLSGGTGQFAGFEASVAVTYTGGPNWAWDGTYSFTPPGLNGGPPPGINREPANGPALLVRHLRPTTAW